MAEGPKPNPEIVSDDELLRRLPELAQKAAVAVFRARLNERVSCIMGWGAQAGAGALIVYDLIHSMLPGQHLSIPLSHSIIETGAVVAGLAAFWNAGRERIFIEELFTAVQSPRAPTGHGHFRKVEPT